MNLLLRARRAVSTLGLVVLCGSVAGAACASGGFNGREYRKGNVAFRVGAMPERWKRIEVSNATLAFEDGQTNGTAFVNARCKDVDDAPLLALTNQLLAGTTEREYALEETIPFDGREARHTRVKAKLDGVEMAYDIYVMKKDGCIYDFVYVAPPAAFEAGVQGFAGFVQGFHTLEGSGT